jgi:endonuclease-3
MATINWSKAFQPLIELYKDKKHPLDYENTYQLIVMVVLSAQDSDKHINQVAIEFFKEFSDFKTLALATEENLLRHLNAVRNFGNKIKWLLAIANDLKEYKETPLTMEKLTSLPGIGRKSANVIRRESGLKAEGAIVDLHVVRVAPRIGIATGTDPKKIEASIMNALPPEQWEAGMSMSFLGREICRPTNPKCIDCVLKEVCAYCLGNQ